MELGTKRNEVQLSFVPWLLSFLALLPTPSGATRRPRRSEPYLSLSDLRTVPRLPRPRLAGNLSGGNLVRPNHLFGHHFDHDYEFELPRNQGAGCPINRTVIYCTPWPVTGCPTCEPTAPSAGNPISYATSNRGRRRACVPSPPWRSRGGDASPGAGSDVATRGQSGPRLAPPPPARNVAERYLAC